MLADDPKKPETGQILRSILNHSGNDTIEIFLEFLPGELENLLATKTIHKVLKLTTKLNTSNMHLHNKDGIITKYDTVLDILQEFYTFRYSMYEKRKEYQLKKFKNDLLLAEWRLQFVKDVLSGKIVVIKSNRQGRSKQDIIDDLTKFEYPMLSRDPYAADSEKNYGYITSIPLFALTPEEMDKLNEVIAESKRDYEAYNNLTIEMMWTSELDKFEKEYVEWLNNSGPSKTGGKKTTKGKGKKN
jgi:DNA topoisomerase-2